MIAQLISLGVIKSYEKNETKKDKATIYKIKLWQRLRDHTYRINLGLLNELT